MEKPNLLLKKIGHLREQCRQQIHLVNAFLTKSGKETIAWKDPGNLKLALFGQYNAGKSTLVNAILGEPRASMGDGPETKVANSYDWQGFTILDLPGRNARADEDKEALSGLAEAHAAILMVSSRTGLDYDTIWSDMQLLDDKSIPYVLVINDKQGHQSDSAEICYRDEIVGRFIKHAESRLRKVPPFYWINARRAFDARREGKMLLEKKSGIITLENALADCLYSNDGLLRDMAELKEASSILEQFHLEVSQSTLNEEIQEYSERLAWCGQVQEKLKALAQSIAEEQFTPLRAAIAATYEQAIFSGQGQGVQAQVRNSVTQSWEAASDAYSCQAKAELSDNKWSLDIWDNYLSQDQYMSDGPDDYSVPSKDKGNAQFDQAIRSALNIVGDMMERAVENGGKELVEQAGKQVTKEAVKNLVQNGGKKVAGKGGKYLGPALQVVAAGWDVYQGYQKAENEKQLVSTALKKADADAALAVAMIKQLFMGKTVSYSIEQLKPIKSDARRRLIEVKGDYSAVKQVLEEVVDIQLAVQTLIDQVSSHSYGF